LKTKNLFFGLLSSLLLLGCDRDEGPTYGTPTAYNYPTYNTIPMLRLPQDNIPTQEGVRLGKKLFFDANLSRNGTQSCGSCHNQQFAFTDNLLAVSIGINGQEGSRNSMPLFNLMWHNEFFWDGRAATLREQALMPIEDPLEMDHSLEAVVQYLSNHNEYPDLFGFAFGTPEVNKERIGLALEQFMLTLISGDSKYDRFLRGEEQLTDAEERGRLLFFTEVSPTTPGQGADCFHCHGGGLFTNNQFINNGLDENLTDLGYYEVTGLEFDKGKFKTPSLRNIAVSGPYMHDGRFQTLEEVIEHYNSGVAANSPNLDPNMHALEDGLGLTQQQKDDLIAFLHTLTDYTYLNNPEYQAN